MTFDEAMVIVDAGGIVSRETDWQMRAAGFAWGTWVSLERLWTVDDSLLEVARTIKGDWSAPSIEPSGSTYRAQHTLCESFPFDGDLILDFLRDATDWIDVTDRFENGTPKGYIEHMTKGHDNDGS